MTEPIITNTLPLVFDKINNRATFKYQLGKPNDQSNPSLSILLEYLFHKANGHPERDKIGSLSYRTILSIEPIYDLNTKFNLFHWGLEKSIKNFRVEFKKLGVINYPQGEIRPPTFADMLPNLIELFSPEVDLN